MGANKNIESENDTKMASPYSTPLKDRIRDLTHKTMLLIIIQVVIKAFGLVRMAVMAAIFGATTNLDMFFAIFGSTIVLFEVLPPAFNQALVPRYVDLIVKGDRDAFNRAVSISINWVILIALVVVWVSVENGTAIREIFFQFPEDTAQMYLTWANWLFKLALVYLFMNVFIGSFTAILYAHDQVISPSILNFINGINVLICMVLFHSKMGIFSLVLGYLTGGVCQIIYLGYFVIRTGFRWNPFTFFSKDAFWNYVRPIGPAYLAMVIAQLNIIIDRGFTSRLGEAGHVALLQYASQLLLIVLIFSHAFSNALLPKLSSSRSLNRPDEFRTLLVDGILVVLFMMMPIAVIAFAAARPLCNLVLFHGKFADDPNNLYLTLYIFRILLVWSVLYFVNTQFFNAFYTYRDFRTPMLISSCNVIANVLFNMMLTGITFGLAIPVIRTFGVAGIAFSTACGIVVSIILSLIFLKGRLGNLLDMYALKHIAKMTVAAIAALSVAILILNRKIFSPMYEGAYLDISLALIQIVTISVVTFIVYMGISYFINRSRVRFVYFMVRDFIKRKKTRSV